jgi:hypothetical protein
MRSVEVILTKGPIMDDEAGLAFASAALRMPGVVVRSVSANRAHHRTTLRVHFDAPESVTDAEIEERLSRKDQGWTGRGYKA